MEDDGNLDELLSLLSEETNKENNETSKLREISIFDKDSEVTENKEGTGAKNGAIHKGDTDSSDDEEARNHESRYNNYGKQVNELLKTDEQNNYNRSLSHSSSTVHSKNWKTKLPATQSLFSPEVKLAVSQCGASYDPIFGIKIANPLISSAVLKERMIGREAIPFNSLSAFILTEKNKNVDWVIGGVIVQKSETRTSQKGSQYSIWTVSDLKNDLKIISLFLFKNAYKNLWKTPVGSVVAVLNPSVLNRRKDSKDEATLSIDNPDRVMILGQSKDLGFCKSVKKNGETCHAFVNLSVCDFCIFHVKQEYNKFSKRSDIQGAIGNRGLIALRNKVLGKNEVFYAGKSFTAIKQNNKKLVDKDTSRMQALVGKQNFFKSNILNPKSSVNKLNAARVECPNKQRIKDLDRLKLLGASVDKLENLTRKNVEIKPSETIMADEARKHAKNLFNQYNKGQEDTYTLEINFEEDLKTASTSKQLNDVQSKASTSENIVNKDEKEKSISTKCQKDNTNCSKNSTETPNFLVQNALSKKTLQKTEASTAFKDTTGVFDPSELEIIFNEDNEIPSTSKQLTLSDLRTSTSRFTLDRKKIEEKPIVAKVNYPTPSEIMSKLKTNIDKSKSAIAHDILADNLKDVSDNKPSPKHDVLTEKRAHKTPNLSDTIVSSSRLSIMERKSKEVNQFSKTKTPSEIMASRKDNLKDVPTILAGSCSSPKHDMLTEKTDHKSSVLKYDNTDKTIKIPNFSDTIASSSRLSLMERKTKEINQFSKTKTPSEIMTSLRDNIKNNVKPTISPTMNINAARMMSKSRLNALQYIAANGPIEKQDPNNIKGSKSKKRILDKLDAESPERKRAKVDEEQLLKARMKEIIEAKSINEHLITRCDQNAEEKHFQKLELKERLEEKMMSTFKVACKAVKCLQCKYTSFSASEFCKTERHPLKVLDATKRFYKCRNCSKRTVTLDLLPMKECSNCGGTSWERTTMMQQRTVNVGENLSLCGGEEMFLGSNIVNGNINLLIPE